MTKASSANKFDYDKIYYILKQLEKENKVITFKNRVEMCKTLGINNTNGNQRNVQNKFLAAVFDHIKEKQKIIVTKIHEDYYNRIPHRFKYTEVFDYLTKYPDIKSAVYGIYADDELVYIGSSTDMEDRIRNHCRAIYEDFNTDKVDEKYITLHKMIEAGRKIRFEVLDSNINEDNRYIIEYEYIDKHKPILNTIGTIKSSIYSKETNIELINKYKEEIKYHQEKIKELNKKIKYLDAQYYLSDRLIKIKE